MPLTKRSLHAAIRAGILMAAVCGSPAGRAQEEPDGRDPAPEGADRGAKDAEGALERLGRAGARALDEALARAMKALEAAEPALDEAAAGARDEARAALEAASEAIEAMELSETLARGIEQGAVSPLLDETLRAAEEIVRGLDPDRLRELGARAIDVQKEAESRLRALEEDLRRSPAGSPVEAALHRAGSKLARGLREALEELEPAPAIEGILTNIDLEAVLVSALRAGREALRHGTLERALAEGIRGLELEETLQQLLRSAQEALGPAESEIEWH
jgi:hypothetical protein